LKNLGKLRNEKKWSQKKLSEMAGVSQTYISELEAGKKHPTVPIAQKLATALGVSLSGLLNENEELDSLNSQAS